MNLNPVALKKHLDRSRLRYRHYAKSTISQIMSDLDSISQPQQKHVKMDRDLEEINQRQSKQIDMIQFI